MKASCRWNSFHFQFYFELVCLEERKFAAGIKALNFFFPSYFARIRLIWYIFIQSEFVCAPRVSGFCWLRFRGGKLFFQVSSSIVFALELIVLWNVFCGISMPVSKIFFLFFFVSGLSCRICKKKKRNKKCLSVVE